MTDPVDIAIGVAIVGASLGSVSILWILVRGLVRRWVEPGAAVPPSRDLEELRDAVAHLGAEVGELQERLDFTERMLARHNEPQRLTGAEQE